MNEGPIPGGEHISVPLFFRLFSFWVAPRGEGREGRKGGAREKEGGALVYAADAGTPFRDNHGPDGRRKGFLGYPLNFPSGIPGRIGNYRLGGSKNE